MAAMISDTYMRGKMPQSRHCDGCAHYQGLCGNVSSNFFGARVCLYILDTGHMRGCPPGPGCTRRISRKDWARTPEGIAALREQRQHTRKKPRKEVGV